MRWIIRFRAFTSNSVLRLLIPTTIVNASTCPCRLLCNYSVKERIDLLFVSETLKDLGFIEAEFKETDQIPFLKILVVFMAERGENW